MVSIRRVPWWAWASLALLVLAVAVGLAGRYLVRQYAPLLSKERVEAELGAALGRAIRVDGITLSPWLGRAELRGLAVAAGPDWSAGTLLAVERLQVTVGLASLWRRELVISRVHLDGVDVAHVATPGGGGFRLPDVIPDRFALGPVTVAVRVVEVSRGRLAFSTRGQPRRVTLQGLAVTATPSDGGVVASGDAETVSVSLPGFDETFDAVVASVRLRGDRLSIERLEGRWRGERLSTTGDITGLGGQERLTLRAAGAVPLAWLGERLGAPWPLHGVAAANATIEGPVSGPAVSARVRIPELRGGPVSARRVTGVVAWSQATLRLADVTADAFGGQVAGALTWSPARPADSVLDVRFTAVSLAALDALARTGAGVKGEVTGRAELRGDLARPRDLRGRVAVAEGSVRLPGELAKLGPAAITAELDVAAASASIVRGEARWPLVRLDGIHGRVGTAGPDGLKAVATGDAGRLARLFGAAWLDGNATVDVEASGAWSDPEITGRARSPSLRVTDARLTDVDVTFGARGRTARIPRAVATLGATRLEASGVLRVPGSGPLDARALGERLDVTGDVRTAAGRLEDFAPWLPAEWQGTGPFTLTASVDGRLDAWRARGAAAGGPLAIRGERIEGLDARFDARPDRVEVSRLIARIRDVPVTASGVWAWTGSGSLRGEAGPVSLARLPGVSDAVKLAGVATARGEAVVRAGRWSGSATIDGRDVRAAGVVLGRGTAMVFVRDDVASVEASFPGARLTARAKGRIDRTAPAEVRVGFVDLDLEPLLVRAGRVPEPVGPVRAVVSGAAELSVPFDAPANARGTVTLDAAHIVAAGETWRAVSPIVLRREPGTTRAERLRLESPAGTIAVRGAVGDDGRLALALDGRAPLGPLARWRPEIRETRGVLEATVEVGGTFAAPAIEGRGSVRDGSLLLRDVPHPVTDVRADLAFTRERLRVSGGRASILGSTVTVSGDVVLEPRPPRLDLAVDGEVPLGVLAAFRPEIREARGLARVTARIGGTVDRPEPSGQATVQAEYLSLRDYAEPLRDVRARLTASASRVSLTDAVATVGGGTVRATGGLALQAFTPGSYAFHVEARRVSIEPIRDFATTWDADLELAGGGGRAQARGEARLVRGAWVSETPLLRLLVERGVPSSPSPEEGVALSIRLVLGDNLLIRTAVARLRARGTLDLQGTTAAPILFGTVDAADGQIMFRKHRFTVTRAAARFVDPRRIDPVLDVQATARIAQYEVRLQVTGRTDSLEVRLASSPPLPEEDVLSLVAFGTTRADLGKGGAGALVGEVAGLILQDLFGIGGGPGLGPLDVFEMKSTETSGRTLEMGKRVGERATVTYSQGLENTAERRLRLEYEVVGPLVIAGEQDFRGGFGGDVLLRLRFR